MELSERTMPPSSASHPSLRAAAALGGAGAGLHPAAEAVPLPGVSACTRHAARAAAGAGRWGSTGAEPLLRRGGEWRRPAHGALRAAVGGGGVIARPSRQVGPCAALSLGLGPPCRSGSLCVRLSPLVRWARRGNLALGGCRLGFRGPGV